MQGYQRAMNYFFCGSHIDIIEDNNNTLAMESFYMLAIAPIMMAAIFPSLDVSWLWWQMLLSLLGIHSHSHYRVWSVTTTHSFHPLANVLVDFQSVHHRC
jgi:hypothetical protein